MIKKNDIILIGVIVFLGLVAAIVINVTKSEGSKLLVTVDGEEYGTYDLNTDQTLQIKLNDGEWNTFEIKNGVVDMIDASCPDKLCVNHNNIHYNHETIVCLPNKVVLEIVNGEEDDIDAVVR